MRTTGHHQAIFHYIGRSTLQVHVNHVEPYTPLFIRYHTCMRLRGFELIDTTSHELADIIRLMLAAQRTLTALMHVLSNTWFLHLLTLTGELRLALQVLRSMAQGGSPTSIDLPAS